jgi:hypothetical protein
VIVIVPPFVLGITCELKGLGHVQSVGCIFVKVNTFFEGPSKGSSTTFKLLPLNGCLIFSSFLKAYLLSYCEFGSITFTSNATTDAIPWWAP